MEPTVPCPVMMVEQTADGKHLHRCERCGYERVHRCDRLTYNCGRLTAERILSCDHRGEEVRAVSVDACCGREFKIRVPVYACAIFGECDATALLTDQVQCRSCPRHTGLAALQEEKHNAL